MIDTTYALLLFHDGTAAQLWQSETKALYALLCEYQTSPQEMPLSANRGIDWVTAIQEQTPPIAEVMRLQNNNAGYFTSLMIKPVNFNQIGLISFQIDVALAYVSDKTERELRDAELQLIANYAAQAGINLGITI